MQAQPFFVPPKDYSQPLHVVGEQVTVLASGGARSDDEDSLTQHPKETEMKAEPFVVSPDTYEPALNVLGVSVTVLASNIQTQGYEITLQSGGEGAGPPPHRHVWDESFFVLRGSVEFSIDDKADLCGPRTLVHLPAGTVHSYRFGAGGGALFEIAGQGGNATRLFAQVSREVPPGPPDVPALTSLLQQNGVTLMLG